MILSRLSLFTTLFFSLSGNSWADDFDYPHLPTISKTLHGKVILKVECPQVETQVKSLRAWTKSVEKRVCQEPPMRVDFNGLCVLDVTDCVPKRVVELHGMATREDGPNCWNTSLVFHNLIPHIRESSLAEYDTFISSKLCKEIKFSQSLKPGDMGSIATEFPDGKNQPLHSFIYINPRLAFQKRGLEQFAGFSLVNMRDVFKDYPLELTGDCKKNCSPKVGFEDLVSDSNYNLLVNRYPALTIPDPKYFCRMFHQESKDSLDTLNIIFKEEIPHLRPQEIQEIIGILFQGCRTFSERLGSIKEAKKTCEWMCPKPKLKYYRCQNPKAYFNKLSGKGLKLYLEMQNFLSPLSRAIENYYLRDIGKFDSLKIQLRTTVNELSKYLQEKKIDYKRLSPNDKLAIDFNLIQLKAIAAQLNEEDFLKKNLTDYLK